MQSIAGARNEHMQLAAANMVLNGAHANAFRAGLQTRTWCSKRHASAACVSACDSAAAQVEERLCQQLVGVVGV